MNESNNHDLQPLIDSYFACWNASDEVSRAEAIARTWAMNGSSVDPLADVTGHEELAAMFAGALATFPGSSFRQRGGIDSHHSSVRWGWEMVDGDGNLTLDGIDVAEIDAEGKIARLTGFFGYELPENA